MAICVKSSGNPYYHYQLTMAYSFFEISAPPDFILHSW